MTDQVMPDGAWEFDADVTEVFDDMLERSIPDYHSMRELVTSLADRYLTRAQLAGRGPRMLDLGSSRGDVLARQLERTGARATYTGVEISEPMFEVCVERLRGWMQPGLGMLEMLKMDLRSQFPMGSYDVVTAVLTLMFIPVEYRARVVRNAYDSLLPGGALIVIEKVRAYSHDMDEVMTGEYLDLKSANGYTPEEIDRKRHALEGVLVPDTAHGNEALLKSAGFGAVECVWRWMNFAGWLAVKV